MYRLLYQNLKVRLCWWLNGKESACQCRRHGSIPDLERPPHALKQLSPCGTTIEPSALNYWSLCTLEPVLCSTRPPVMTSLHATARLAPTHSYSRKARAATKTSTAKNTYTLKSNFKVITNQKSTIDTLTQKKNKSKHNARVSHQITRAQKRKERKKPTKKFKRIKKMVIETDVSIITLTGNGLKSMKRQNG